MRAVTCGYELGLGEPFCGAPRESSGSTWEKRLETVRGCVTNDLGWVGLKHAPLDKLDMSLMGRDQPTTCASYGLSSAHGVGSLCTRRACFHLSPSGCFSSQHSSKLNCYCLFPLQTLKFSGSQRVSFYGPSSSLLASSF